MNSGDAAVPAVVVCNNQETYHSFFGRGAGGGARVPLLAGDPALFYCGPDKLVIASTLAPHLDYVREQLGYSGTTMAAPEKPSLSLCNDLLADDALLRRLIAYAGPGQAIRLIPFATTPEFIHLVDELQRTYGLRVLTPESPAPEALWVRDRMDTKSGFHTWASEWLPDGALCLPRAAVSESLGQAAVAAMEFAAQGVACVVKADTGVGGLGQLVVRPGEYGSRELLLRQLCRDPFLRGGAAVVEELIDSPGKLFPSLEFFVPPAGTGEPASLYLCDQVFLSHGLFEGVLIDRSSLASAWYQRMAEDGLTIACRLQALGYAGFFDLDAIVDGAGRLYLLEVNPRRTGGTHAHEFARQQFGVNYVQQVTVLALNRLSSGAISTWPALQAALSDLLFSQGSKRQGAVVTTASLLAHGEFGCLIVAPSQDEASAIYAEIERRMRLIGGGDGDPVQLPPTRGQDHVMRGN